jgi:hypothetical protein
MKKSTISFTKVFFRDHPRFNEKTNFPVKLWKAFDELGYKTFQYSEASLDDDSDYYRLCKDDIKPKWSSIRRNRNYTKGTKVSPRVWNGPPRKSGQILLAEPIKIYEEYPIEINDNFVLGGQKLTDGEIENIALNMEGYENMQDFFDWFKRGIKGQIVIWSNNIKF